MPGIFISYRREDTGGYAQRLFDSISATFGRNQVFMDVDSIEAGADFSLEIRRRLSQCNVFLELIGRNWVRCTDARGRRRLEDSGDLVRIEVAQALHRGIRIIPVLLGGAPMPRPEELPADIRPLALHNAHEIPDRFFKQAVRELIRLLKTYVQPVWVTRRTLALTAAGIVLLALGIAAAVVQWDKTPPHPARNDAAAAELPLLEVPGAQKPPPVVVRQMAEVSEPPAPVPGAWTIDKLNFARDVSGPRRPRALWEVAITIGDTWGLVGFAPDGTLYVWDAEHRTLEAIRDGKEAWAYSGGSLQGITPDGRIWLEGVYGPGDVRCFNSKGEGGHIRNLRQFPHNLLRAVVSSMPSEPTCSGGVVTLPGAHERITVDGNCSSWGVFRDELNRYYAGTDRGTVYSWSSQGARLWKYDAGGPVTSRPISALEDAVLATADRLFCLRNGALRWSTPMRSAWPALADKAGTVYLSYYHGAYTQKGGDQVTCAVDRDGHIIWKRQPGMTPAALDPQGRLYLVKEAAIMCVGDE